MIEYVEGTNGYQPGVCNIGPAEIRRRRLLGYVGLVAAAAMALLLLAIDAPAWMRLGLALPVAAGLEGIIQARERFCAGYAMAGIQNMGEPGSQTAVDDDEARAADRRKAMRIHAMSIAGGLAAGVIFAILAI